MARYIDADKLEKHLPQSVPKHNVIINGNEYTVFLVDHILHEIRNYPTFDVAEVVRCNNCTVPHNQWTGCPKLNGLITPPDFYCSYGERIRER